MMFWTANRPARSVCTVALIVALGLGCSPAAQAKEAAPRGKVTLKRDRYGVPHIYASTNYGLFYGFGYALAEDRLFQMEMLRRTARGTVAEVLGPKYVDHDRATRANYSPASIKAQYEALPAVDRQIFDGYAAGLNARVKEVLADRETAMPREFIEFGFEPSEWSATDVITLFVHSIAIRYSDGNSEITNLSLLTRLVDQHGAEKGRKLFDQFRWEHDPHAPTTIAAEDQLSVPPPTFAVPGTPATKLSSLVEISPAAAAENRAAQVARYGGGGPDSFLHASNLWIIGPGKSKSGQPVLVNGPQMGDFSPGYIWAAGLHGAGFDLVGSGPMGSPWLIFGTNGNIGWGATAGLGDTVDIYQERLNAGDPHRYFFNGEYRAMEKRTEDIKVKGGTAVKAEIFSTVHGPVVQFDMGKGIAYSKKRSWAGSEVQSLLAWINAMKAKDFGQWRKAISTVTLPINNYYIDRSGNIGYTFLGKIPRRPRNQDFRLPASGTGDMEWSGFLPFESSPWVFNPKRGYISNWNNKPQPNYNSSDFIYWSGLDHLAEIDQQLVAQDKLSESEALDINRRIMFRDNNAGFFLPLIASAAARFPKDSNARRAADLLANWDGKTVGEKDGSHSSAGYVLFRHFLTELVRQTLAPAVPSTAMGKDTFEFTSISPYFPSMGIKITYNALLGAKAGVAQEVDLLDGAAPGDAIRQALESAMIELVARHGADPDMWVKPATPHDFSTENYAGIPQTVGRNALRLPAAMNRGTENNLITFDNGEVRYCDVTPPGQSGYVNVAGEKSPHYADQLELYAKNGCKQQLLKQSEVDREAVSVKELRF